MKFSIVVPIYKVEKYLSQCIESILSQTYENFELILVDDGSPDSCPNICDEYAKKDDRVRVIHKKNGGLVSARKAGLEIARGDYVCFVDGDDFVSFDMLESYEKELARNRVDVICTGYSEYCNADKITRVPQKMAYGVYDKNKLQSEIYPKMLSTKPFYSFYMCPTVWSKCFRRSLCEEAIKDVPNNISMGEDVAVVYHALLKADSISVIDYCGYMYRQIPTSMSRTRDEKFYEKVRSLIVYLKTVEETTGWQAGDQINEYAIFILMLATNNEFKYNQSATYRTKKRNMKRYLNDPIFKNALDSVALSGTKYKFMQFCFKTRFLLPICFYENMKK